jgi:hypothetical protein
MALRAEEWLMLGIASLGVYSIFRLTRASSSSSEETPIPPTERVPQVPIPPPAPLPAPLPAPAPAPPANLPQVPGAAAPPLNLPLIAGPSLHLTNSRAYRARLETTGASGPLSQGATRQEIVDFFTGLGFDNAQAFMSPEEARGHFLDGMIAGAGQGTRWVYGRYTGPTRDVPRPAGLAYLWISSQPSTSIGWTPPLQFASMKG